MIGQATPFMLYGRYAGCGELFEYWRYNELVQRGLTEGPSSPALVAELEAAAYRMGRLGCEIWQRALANAAIVARSRLPPPPRVIRPVLGRPPRAPSAPPTVEELRSALSRAEARGAVRIAEVLRAQLARIVVGRAL